MLFIVNNAFRADASRILAVLPFPSKSHYAVIDPVLMRLAELGHHVTVYNPYTKNRVIPNYVEHDLSICSESKPSEFGVIEEVVSLANNKWFFALLFATFWKIKKENIVDCEPLYKLLKSDEKFDLLITESFNSDLMLLYAHKFRIPFITFVSCDPFPWLMERTQNPFNPSYVPTVMTSHLPKMTFLERMDNTLYYLLLSFVYNYFVLNQCERVNKELLGPESPSLYDTVKNTSILLLVNHHSINAMKPLMPAVVEIAGTHIKPAALLPRVCNFKTNFIPLFGGKTVAYVNASILGKRSQVVEIELCAPCRRARNSLSNETKTNTTH